MVRIPVDLVLGPVAEPAELGGLLRRRRELLGQARAPAVQVLLAEFADKAVDGAAGGEGGCVVGLGGVWYLRGVAFLEVAVGLVLAVVVALVGLVAVIVVVRVLAGALVVVVVLVVGVVLVVCVLRVELREWLLGVSRVDLRHSGSCRVRCLILANGQRLVAPFRALVHLDSPVNLLLQPPYHFPLLPP